MASPQRAERTQEKRFEEILGQVERRSANWKGTRSSNYGAV